MYRRDPGKAQRLAATETASAEKDPDGEGYEDLLSGFASVAAGGHAPQSDLIRSYLYGWEWAHVVEALERNDWVIGRSAAELGISRKNLWERMRHLGIAVHS